MLEPPRNESFLGWNVFVQQTPSDDARPDQAEMARLAYEMHIERGSGHDQTLVKPSGAADKHVA